jgi:hypothetical protein
VRFRVTDSIVDKFAQVHTPVLSELTEIYGYAAVYESLRGASAFLRSLELDCDYFWFGVSGEKEGRSSDTTQVLSLQQADMQGNGGIHEKGQSE